MPRPARPPSPAATLAVTSAATAVALMTYTAPMVTLPATAADLHTPLSAQAWLLNGTPLGLAALLLVAGSLADDYGRRRAFLSRHDRPRHHHGAGRTRHRHLAVHAGPRRPGRGERGDPRQQPRPPRPRVPARRGTGAGHRDLGRVRQRRHRGRPAARGRHRHGELALVLRGARARRPAGRRARAARAHRVPGRCARPPRPGGRPDARPRPRRAARRAHPGPRRLAAHAGRGAPRRGLRPHRGVRVGRAAWRGRRPPRGTHARPRPPAAPAVPRVVHAAACSRASR